MSAIGGLRVNFQGMLVSMEQRILRAQSRGLIAVAAIQSFPDSVELAQAFDVSTAVFVGDAPVSNSSTRADATAFVISSAIREAIDSISLLCEEVGRIAKFYGTPLQNGTIPVLSPIDFDTMSMSEIFDGLVGPQRTLDGGGLKDKLDLLSTKFGINADYRDEAESINKARTCLTHRLGRVGLKDTNDAAKTQLRVFYRATEVVIVDPEGRERPAVGATMQPGDRLGTRFNRPKELTFPLGSQVVIDLQAAMCMLSTLLMVGRSLLHGCSAYVTKSQGGESPPPTSRPPA